MKNNLGKEGTDKVTDFKGIITGYIQYLTGCHQYGLAAKVGTDGKIPDTQWFDVNRIEITGKGVSVEEVADEKNPGGPNRDCPK